MIFIVLDSDGARCSLICRVIAECGAQALTVADPLALLHLKKPAAYAGLIIAVSAGQERRDLAAIRHIAALGVAVVSVEGHAAPWSIRMRSRVLLAGAQHLLNSAESGFEAALASTIVGITRAGTERKNEDDRLGRTFKALGLVGAGPSMMAVFRRVEKISQFSDLPALILGESGTGKELVARAIHRLDPKRCDKPFVAVNCAAINASLAESEFFGHRRGAYTGADRERKGLFRAAHGGVLFLDEIGELNIDLQAKLLRVLQEQRVLGVGEDQEAPVDLRVVAATNRDLRRMVEEKRFREDLYHRLKLLPVEIPPLRQRPEDIAPLVDYFLGRHAGRNMVAGGDYLEAIGSLRLSGNVRELENLVRSSLVEKKASSPLGLGDLPVEIWNELSADSQDADDAVVQADAKQPVLEAAQSFLNAVAQRELSLAESLACCEKLLLEAALRRTQNNQSQAARLLGITPRSVYNKLRRYHIQN
jgi:transcriptional regulator with GAF, ATPase, and Fis domain